MDKESEAQNARMKWKIQDPSSDLRCALCLTQHFKCPDHISGDLELREGYRWDFEYVV
jgi:hypothetical protein